MEQGSKKTIQINEGLIKSQLGEVVLETVEETLNKLLDAEADELCKAQRYERSPDRVDTRAGSYERTLDTLSGRDENFQVYGARKLWHQLNREGHRVARS